jgi:hypothetical protein
MNELKIIQQEIEAFYNLPKDYIWQNTRKREVVIYRHLFFYLRSKIQPQLSYAYVSQYSQLRGMNRNHATQINSRKIIENLIFWNTDNMANNVNDLLDILEPIRFLGMAKINNLKKVNTVIRQLRNDLKEAKQKKRELLLVIQNN